MREGRAFVVAPFALLVALAGHAEKQWTECRNQELGFRMLVPPGVQPVTPLARDGYQKAQAQFAAWASSINVF